MENLKTPLQQERAAFLAILNYAASINGITEEEISFINELAEQFGIGEEETLAASKPRMEEEILGLTRYIVNQRNQLQLIKELFFLGYADGNLSDEEIIFLSKLSSLFGIPDDTLERISQWVIQGIEWQEEGEAIFGPEDDYTQAIDSHHSAGENSASFLD